MLRRTILRRPTTAAVLITFFLAACSIEISDVTPAATVPPATAGVATSTLPSAATRAPTPTSTGPAWATLNLSGSFVYTQGAQGVLKLDLVTGESTSLLPPADKTWLSAATVSPDGKTIVIAYAPPPTGDEVQLGYTGLYEIPMDGTATAPKPLLERVDPQESYFTPAFTPDGRYLYFAHFVPIRSSSGNTFKYSVERIEYPDGEPEVIVEDAIWPRPSPDGVKLAYLKFDTQTYSQELTLSDLDGQNAEPVLPPGEFPSVDAQFFSPDGKTIVFNAVGQGKSPALSWLDRLMGVQVAEAHNVPSDWWSISLGETHPARLTELYDTGMYGDFSPDGKHIGFISASGLYVMPAPGPQAQVNPDGSQVTPLLPIDTLGTLEWAP